MWDQPSVSKNEKQIKQLTCQKLSLLFKHKLQKSYNWAMANAIKQLVMIIIINHSI